MSSDDHYVQFTDVYCTDTSENERPSLIQRRKVKTLTYSLSQQHTSNAGVLVQSDECDKWPLFFSKRKLSAIEHAQLEGIIADVSYSCGDTKADLNVPDTLKSVGIGSHNGSDPIEKIYYSAYQDDLICFTVAVRMNSRYLSSQILFISTVQTVCCPNVFTNAILCSVLHFMHVPSILT